MVDVRGTLPDGALVKPLRRVVNERGDLLEVLRSDDAELASVGQAYLTTTFPGVVRAWYRHHRQVDQLAVVDGRAQLVLHDDREDSPTVGATAEFVFGDVVPALVVVPAGVWHGFRPVGGRPVTILHLNDTAIDLADPDEERLPADAERIPFRWTAI